MNTPNFIWNPLVWFLLWLTLMSNNPLEASTQEQEQPAPQACAQTTSPDLGILKEAALIGGACSIITAIIWAFGLTTTARYKYLGRRNSSCGDQLSNS